MNSKQREMLFDEVVTEILQERGGDIPSQNTVVVHVRLSDVLWRDNCWELPPCTGRVKSRFYAYPFLWYDNVVHVIRKAFRGGTPPNIVVVGFAHHNTDTEKVRRSHEYRAKMVKYFKQHGFSASARIDSLPDDDFLYMTRAKFFVPGGGGFSRMISHICEKHGGRIFRVEIPSTEDEVILPLENQTTGGREREQELELPKGQAKPRRRQRPTRTRKKRPR